MRFINKQYMYSAQIGQRRIVRKFLLRPRRFSDSPCSRWLEFANILEEMVCREDPNLFKPGYTKVFFWKEVGFTDMENNDGIL